MTADNVYSKVQVCRWETSKEGFLFSINVSIFLACFLVVVK